MNGDPGDVFPAALEMDEEQHVHVVGHLWLLKNLSRRSTAFQSDMLLAEWSMF
jgi:hypothetical protein